MSFKTGEALLEAVVVEGEFFVINAEQVKRSGVKFITMSDVFDRFEAKLIRAAVTNATRDAASSCSLVRCSAVSTNGGRSDFLAMITTFMS